MTADKVTLRIDDLARNYLRKIATDESGWETLYQDPAMDDIGRIHIRQAMPMAGVRLDCAL